MKILNGDFGHDQTSKCVYSSQAMCDDCIFVHIRLEQHIPFDGTVDEIQNWARSLFHIN